MTEHLCTLCDLPCDCGGDVKCYACWRCEPEGDEGDSLYADDDDEVTF